jgi:hypothetical protein
MKPVRGVIACTAAYGGLKLYWALGGTAGLREAPLPADAIRAALAREPSVILGHWVSVALAAAGIGVALLAGRTTSNRRPNRTLRWSLALLAALFVVRATLQATGDVQRLVVGVSAPSAATARWDLALWSPYFLIWGVCWALLVRTRPDSQRQLL